MCLEKCLEGTKTWEGERHGFPVGWVGQAESGRRKRRGEGKALLLPHSKGWWAPGDKEETLERGKAWGRKKGPVSELQSRVEK